MEHEQNIELHSSGETELLSLPVPVYLDYNATTPLDEQVIAEVTRSLRLHWGNPSSLHVYGEQANDAIEQSRMHVAKMINSNPTDIIFTSGGTEGNNLALLSLIKSARTKYPNIVPHIITSNVEHDSVAGVLKDQRNMGQIELTSVPVDKYGQMNANVVLSFVRENTCVISIMHANNETGIIMPIQDISRKLSSMNTVRNEKELPQISFHCDAAQTIGKIQVDVADLGVDMLTIVGHKDVPPLLPIFKGGGQERGFRPGTENTPMIVGLGKAAELVQKNLQVYSETMKQLTEELASQLQENVSGLKINFSSVKVEDRLPNTLSICLPPGLQATFILREKCKGKLLASLGAACHSNVDRPSEILLASGLSPTEAARTVRLSVGRTTTNDEIALAVKALKTACM